MWELQKLRLYIYIYIYIDNNDSNNNNKNKTAFRLSFICSRRKVVLGSLIECGHAWCPESPDPPIDLKLDIKPFGWQRTEISSHTHWAGLARIGLHGPAH